LPGPFAGVHLRPPLGQLLLGHQQFQLSLVHVDEDLVAVLDQADGAAARRFRGDVADRQSRGAAGEPAVGDQRALLAESGALQERRRVQHLLHAGAARRALIAHHQHLARLDLLAQDRRDRLLLTLHHPRRALEVEQLLLDAGRLDDRTSLGQVAVQHGQPALDRVRM
jgi:hypothetical protein